MAYDNIKERDTFNQLILLFPLTTLVMDAALDGVLVFCGNPQTNGDRSSAA